MRHRTRLNDIKKRKKRAGLSLLAKKRIIGISTMILAGLLMAVPFFARAGIPGGRVILTDPERGNAEEKGNCGSEGSADDRVIWTLHYPDGGDNATARLTLHIEKNENATFSAVNDGAMQDFAVNGESDSRPWKKYLDRIDEVVVEEGVTRIGNYAFAGIGLKSLSFPEGLKSIGEFAFHRSGIEKVSLPDSMVTIEPYAFYNADALTTVDLFQSADGSMLTTIGENAFSECDNLKDMITFPSHLGTIGPSAFFNDTKLAGALTIPNTVTTLGASAFENCVALTAASLSSGTKTITKQAFKNCSGLTSLTIPEGVEEIGEGAFSGCEHLVSPILLPSSLTTLGAEAFDKTVDATRIRLLGNAPTGVAEAGRGNHTFDDDDVLLVPKDNTTYDVETDDNGIVRWKGYRVIGVDADGNLPTYTAFHPEDLRDYNEVGVVDAQIVNAIDPLVDDGEGYYLEIRDLNKGDTDVLQNELSLDTDDLYHPYMLTLYNQRVSPKKEISGVEIGRIDITLPLPIEIADAVRETIRQGLTNAIEERLKVYAQPLGVSTARYEEIEFEPVNVAGSDVLRIKIKTTHFSQYALVYDSERYGAEPFKYVDLRSDAHQGTNSILYKGVADEGAPEQKEFVITNGINHATAVFSEPASSIQSTNGYRIEFSRSEGTTIREAEWASTGRGIVLDQYRMFAPVEIRLYYNDGISGMEDEEVTDGFGKMTIRLPIPEEMDITARGSLLQVLSAKKASDGKTTIEVKSVANQDLEIRELENSSVKYAVFSTDHFSEFALYYVSNDAASDTSTTASTASTEATTATGATTSSAAGGTTATGAGTSNAAAAGSTATGANTASTATTATTSSTLASGASVAASTGGSGATNRAGATTPVAVTTGSSGSASGSDMPTTGDSDFYRMTLSMALMLFGAYELISTIRIRKKGNR